MNNRSTGYEYEDEDNRPEVIAAKAEAEKQILEARAKLHPAAQVVFTVFDSVGNLITKIGCLIVIAIIVLSICAPTALSQLLNR